MYKFGQLRRTQIESYLTPLTYTFKDIETKSALSQGITFIDKAIVLTGNNILQSVDKTGTVIKSYYMQIKVFKEEESEQLLTIKLVNTNKTKDNEQTLETITIEQGKKNNFATFEIIIPPNQSYNQIQFILNRISIDYNNENEDGTYGRKINMEILKLKEIYNVINFLNPAIENTGRLKQIGVQSAPGLLMSIEGEAIRVGRSGIYEINNGISVSFIGFVVEPDDNKYFILDYQY